MKRDMAFRRCFDLSLPLTPTILRYPGDPAPRIDTIAACERGDPLTVSHIALSCHVGTHVDAPAHFVAGADTIDRLRLQCFYGPARVIGIDGCGPITVAHVNAIASGQAEHLILATGNSALLSRPAFEPDYRTVTVEAAMHLASLKPLSVGFDYFSVDPPSSTTFSAHMIFARAGIPVFLPLQLDGVEPGEYWFVGMPLPIAGVEACPVRAVLFA